MSDFTLHPDFETTSAPILDLDLSQARLHLDARFPWLILIPRRAAVRDLDELTADDRGRLMEEIAKASAAVRALGEASGKPVEKLNVAALGNVTPQLHVHVLGRRRDDGAWPRPVWGVGEAAAYDPGMLEALLKVARASLAGGS